MRILLNFYYCPITKNILLVINREFNSRRRPEIYRVVLIHLSYLCKHLQYNVLLNVKRRLLHFLYASQAIKVPVNIVRQYVTRVSYCGLLVDICRLSSKKHFDAYFRIYLAR